MAVRLIGRLSRARIRPPCDPDLLDMLFPVQERIRTALRTGLRNERFNRVWRLGGIREQSGCLLGHLGFETRVGVDLWDERTQDFKPTAVQNGYTSPFVVRLSDLMVVFQPRAQKIRVESFVGAMQSMLKAADGRTDWKVVPLNGEMPFERWHSTVKLVSRLRFRADECQLPEGEPSGITGVLLRSRPEAVTLVLRAKNGIDVSGPLVRELLGQAAAGFGEVVALGLRGDHLTEEKTWASALRGEVIVTEAPVDQSSGEVRMDLLLDELRTIDLQPEA